MLLRIVKALANLAKIIALCPKSLGLAKKTSNVGGMTSQRIHVSSLIMVINYELI